jgi:prepilin-type N-terminal cleavage/methylation domain-containing protein
MIKQKHNTSKLQTTAPQNGFTIVELLIVIVVIGILAAITIVAYSSVQERARASSVSTALTQASRKLAVYQVDNPDIFPADKNALEALGVKDTTAINYQYTRTAGPPDTYCLTATTGTTSYKISSASPTPSTGGCAGHGQGGVAAITNLLFNPNLESNSTANNWAYYSSPLSIDSTKAAFGTRSLQTVTNSATNPQGLVFAGQGVPAGTYTCSVYLASSPSASVHVSGRTETPYAESLGNQTIVLSNNFQRVSVTFTLTAAVGTIEIQARLVTAASGITIWGDGAMCVSGTTTPAYADGSSPNWVWTGVANSSTSTGPPS